MTLIQWLLEGDPVIQRLTRIELLGLDTPYIESGYIRRYLDLFDEMTDLWGGGIYGPKWISTHYTLMELKYMQIDPMNSYYQKGLQKVFVNEFNAENPKLSLVHNDLCVIAMLISLASYGQVSEDSLAPLIDYMLTHRMADGGWNCQWDRSPKQPQQSSLHTTLSMLEAIRDYHKSGYMYEKDTLKAAQLDAEAFLLSKHLFRSAKTGMVIRDAFTQFHYPPRWQYDCIRALEYFADVKRQRDPLMQEGIDIVLKTLNKGVAPKGIQYSGKTHFKLENEPGSRFNTLRALKIIKHFAPEQFQFICEREV